MFVIPDVEADTVTYLAGALPDVHVATTVPRDRPDRLVIVSATGGDRRNLAQVNPTVLVEAWGPGSVQARALAGRAWSALTDPDAAWPAYVNRAEPDLPVNYPDDMTKHARYQFTCVFLLNLEVR